MSEILSQDEINALMAAFAGGGHSTDRRAEHKKPARQVKIYDFARPDKFSKEQLRALHILHSKLARCNSTSLTTHLRTSVRVELVSVDQGTYEEYSRSIPNPSVVAFFELAPLPGRAILEVNPNIAFAIIDRMTGGKGEPGGKVRELTEVERALLSRMLQSALQDYHEAWIDIADLKPSLEGLSSTMLFTQIAAPGDMVMVASFEIRLGMATGMMSICIPVAALEPVLPKLNTEQCMGGVRRNTGDSFSEEVTENLSRVPIQCAAILGTATVTVADLINLAEGDVVRLNSTPRNELTFAVGEHRKFHCKPGLVGGKLAVQITGIDEDAAGQEAA